MVVILNDGDYDSWLQAPVPESHNFLRQFPASNLVAVKEQQSRSS